MARNRCACESVGALIRSQSPPLCRSVEGDVGGWFTGWEGARKCFQKGERFVGEQKQVIGISMTTVKVHRGQ